MIPAVDQNKHELNQKLHVTPTSEMLLGENPALEHESQLEQPTGSGQKTTTLSDVES